MAPKTPPVEKAPTPAEIDPEAQRKADQASLKARQQKQEGVSTSSTILTSGAGVTDELETKKNVLG